jgi:hypothetical protein
MKTRELTTTKSHNGRQSPCNQVKRRQTTALVIHNGTLSVKDRAGDWRRHLRQIPQELFLELTPEQRGKIVYAETLFHVSLVENSRLAVTVDRPKSRHSGTAGSQSNALSDHSRKPFSAEMASNGQNGQENL